MCPYPHIFQPNWILQPIQLHWLPLEIPLRIDQSLIISSNFWKLYKHHVHHDKLMLIGPPPLNLSINRVTNLWFITNQKSVITAHITSCCIYILRGTNPTIWPKEFLLNIHIVQLLKFHLNKKMLFLDRSNPIQISSFNETISTFPNI